MTKHRPSAELQKGKGLGENASVSCDVIERLVYCW